MYKRISIFVVVLSQSYVAYGQISQAPATTIQTYRVGDLVSKTAVEMTAMGMTTDKEWGTEYPETLKALTELQDLVEASCSQKPTSVKAYSPSLSLIVRHTAEGHEEVRQLLQTLRQDEPVDLRLECRALYTDVDELLKGGERTPTEIKRLETLLEQKKLIKNEAAELLRFLPGARPKICDVIELRNGRRTSWGDPGRPCTAMGRVDPVTSIAHVRIDFIADNDPPDGFAIRSQSFKLADGESAIFNHDCDGLTVVWLVTASFESEGKSVKTAGEAVNRTGNSRTESGGKPGGVDVNPK